MQKYGKTLKHSRLFPIFYTFAEEFNKNMKYLKVIFAISNCDGTKIYDVETNVKIAEVEKDNMVTTKIKKKLSDKQLIARKEGYAPTPFILETEFNVSTLWNILFWPGFLVDLGTGKMFKWDNTIVNVELEPVEECWE